MPSEDFFIGKRTEYRKAVPGSFDITYFTDLATGNFKFPEYTKNWKGMVRLKDITKYKSGYFSGLYLNKKEKENFSLDDFEYWFVAPEFQIEEFSKFMQRFPEASFNKGISKAGVLSLFDEFHDFIAGRMEFVDDVYFFEHTKASGGLASGLLTAIDVNTDPVKYWSYLSHAELRRVCTANGLKSTAVKETTVQRLVENRILFPFAAIVPSQLLVDTYWAFADMYIQDIKESIDHFHPLYFAQIWIDVSKQCRERGPRKRAEKMYKEPYWTDRIMSATRKYEDDDK